MCEGARDEDIERGEGQVDQSEKNDTRRWLRVRMYECGSMCMFVCIDIV